MRGIQLGLGLGLIQKGIVDKKHGAFVHGAGDEPIWWGWDSTVVSLIMVVTCAATVKLPKFPVALLLFLYGLIYAWTQCSKPLELGLSLHTISPSSADVKTGILQAGLPQLPLTLLNSVVALSLLAKELYPNRSATTPARAAVSLGSCNLVMVWFGALPSCHGAGGLAAQHRFGARTGVSMAFLGILKLSSGLLFGTSLQELCQHFPACVLGTLLGWSGLELASSALRHQKHTEEGASRGQEDLLIILVTAGFELALKSGIAFLAGCTMALLLRIARRWDPAGAQRGGP